MSVLTLAEGTLFAGRYRIVRVIAHGGMGAVYEVVHTETDRHRALKVILPSFLQSEEMRGRFRQEARVTAHIKSDYIVDVLDAGIDTATQMPFLVMELLAGEELDKRLTRVGRLPPRDRHVPAPGLPRPRQNSPDPSPQHHNDPSAIFVGTGVYWFVSRRLRQ